MAKGRIPESDIQAIRERTPIEDIVGEYVQLKPAGVDSLKGLSPFKDEKTPSFHVRPNHGYFHCFSTGKGGDVFTFLMEMEHVSFPEAVEICAEKINYHINYQGVSTQREITPPGTRKRLIEANRAAHKYYREQLETPQAQVARDFLLQRGFSREVIYHFECGYAPDGWDSMTKHLLRLGFEYKELEAAGLSTMGRRGPVDRFRRRLLWPIKNLSGDVIGFGARKLFDDDNLGKYMNTPETLLYKKSKVLFGLDMAKRDIADRHQAVIVEGYTDVMAMHAAGVTTAVASCGTAFGEEHLQMIRRLMLDDSRFRGEIIYTFDGDEAGQKAALRAFEGDQKFAGQSYVSVAPDGMDPCDLRLYKGDVAVRDLVASRVPMFEFVIRSVIAKYPQTSPEERLQAINHAVPIVAGIYDAPTRDAYARRLAGWVGWLQADEVVDLVRKEARRPRRQQQPRRAKTAEEFAAAQTPQMSVLELSKDRKSPLWAERETLKIALQYPLEIAPIFDSLTAETFSNEVYRAVFNAIMQAGGCAAGSNLREFLNTVVHALPIGVGGSFVSELATEHLDIDTRNLASYVVQTPAKLKLVQVDNQIAILRSTLERQRPDQDLRSYQDAFGDLIALERERKKLLEVAFTNK
ncbi:DNA primase [Corynebacterium kutscheri]|uniref:DNA primase n=1 Tax=Corynebacterium kutscheri TaxID=35755 RepID=A0A0F6R1P6_9CORY|nr:DNA primase [Corynebacterium kutscheri]AKE41990.1 DNA primase, catalytic core [Corynebacterium kutscheri]VEH06210.1 DNA primase [Corynebacterium kutscheri]VEH10331.1 DNA primase [Corynebacterium kutscheri]VEH82127.1 DNA primase [Corynebacterium kutscheri]